MSPTRIGISPLTNDGRSAGEFAWPRAIGVIVAAVFLPVACWAQGQVVPVATAPLRAEEDLASSMIAGIDKFLLQKIDDAVVTRPSRWELDHSSAGALQDSLQPHRQRLADALGLSDQRLASSGPELIAKPGGPTTIACSERFDVYAIRWPVLGDPAPQGEGLASLYGEGLLLVPRGKIAADVVVLSDADQTPEQISGLAGGIPPASQVARRLAESGCRVVVPTLISRRQAKRNGRADLTNREYLHRAAFVLGRTLAGYEVQSVLSIVDWYAADAPSRPIGIFGYGEGGMLALFAAGVDSRIDATVVSGFYGPRQGAWAEPLDRNFSGLLQHFGATELALLIGGRSLVVESAAGPELTVAGEGGAPGELRSPDPDAAWALLQQATQRLGDPVPGDDQARFFHVKPAAGAFGSDESLARMLSALAVQPHVVAAADLSPIKASTDAPAASAERREHRLLQQLDRHNQALLKESSFVRDQFIAKLDTRSLDAFRRSQQDYRTIFRDQVIGHFDQPLLPPAARSRKSWETETWTGYEVQLDVFPEVFAYGALLLPKDLKPGERRPVVVCQHGLEGRPTDTFLDNHRAYHDYAAQLCERGFIVFAPQNPYLFQDRFRTLQRKAQPLGKSLFSVIVPQHQQIINWLKTQPFTDPERIAFYGLSYGGKSAMRIPALVTDYCLSICSADFNEWVLKNASSRHKFSYLWTGEYEIFEWNLGSTFNYAEMAALICPRPFMVERGHFDGVGDDHWVAHEYAKVRHLYAAKLGIGERTEIEWFVGPHTINGQATFAFLHRHLDWPAPADQ